VLEPDGVRLRLAEIAAELAALYAPGTNRR